MVPVVVHSIRVARRLDCVETLAYRPVPDRMEMHLEPLAVQFRYVALQCFGIDVAVSVALCPGAVRVDVRFENRRREVLEHAVLHDLHRGRAKTARVLGGTAARDHLGDLLCATGALPPERTDDSCREFPALSHLRVKAEGVSPEVIADDGVLPGGDAQRMKVLLRKAKAGLQFFPRGLGKDLLDKIHRAFVQGSLRRTVRQTFDSAVARVWGLLTDAAEFQSLAVHPCSVPVAVGEEYRPVGNGGVEILRRWCSTIEELHRPASASDPRLVGM